MRQFLIFVCLIFNFNIQFIYLAPIDISNLLMQRLFLSTKSINFMKRFGYLPASEKSESLYKESALVDAIKSLQKFGNIPMSGEIDNKTLELMKMPRCGVADIINSKTREKRYIVGSEGWRKRRVTYYIANWSPKLKEESVIKEMERAFNAWTDYSRLNFQNIDNPNADITISFSQGSHGDGYPFDGQGNILAHAFFPYEMDSFGGDIHFDDDEKWEISSNYSEDGTDFFSVAVHELGHSLGLSHSTIPTSIMFPYYKGYTSGFQLDYDDLLGLYDLYILHHRGEQDIPRTTERVNTKSTSAITELEIDVTLSTISYSTTQKFDFQNITFIGDYESVEEHRIHEKKMHTVTDNFTIPDICQGNFDTISVFRNELFIFKGEYLWHMIQRGIMDNNYPVKFHQLFHGIPNSVIKIDAAYQREIDSSIVLFSGNKYWIYNGERFISENPGLLSDYGIPDHVNKIDAVFVWPKTGKTYFFRDDEFWTINEIEQLDSNYSHDDEKLNGIPRNFDTAMTWTDGSIYFFKDKYFWKFNTKTAAMENNGHPLFSTQYWLGCPE
ncbi:matrix metalloproteinase-25-like [Leptopilina heterotoma]|uniref:matrix metalloproteinase-25-like n=1 Tax=Leptopilina heterotoma TaxID=63436 RepID=UPI001CAA0EA5|nr:matrix metalloproteinase-25-like [Leptopilina heterotoma]